MKGEGLYFSGKRDRAPVSEPFRRGNNVKIFVTYMFVDCTDLPGERDVPVPHNYGIPYGGVGSEMHIAVFFFNCSESIGIKLSRIPVTRDFAKFQ